MVRILCVILCLAMTLGALAACDGGTDEKNTSDTTVSGGTGTKPNDPESSGNNEEIKEPDTPVSPLLESSEGLEFVLNKDLESYTAVGIGSCQATDIVIGNYNGLPVTHIGDDSFTGNENITSLTLGQGVKVIGYNAFAECDALKKVVISHSVETIGIAAFRDCRVLSDITIGDGVTKIEEWAFTWTAHYYDESNYDNGVVYYVGDYLIEKRSWQVGMTPIEIVGDYTVREGTRLIANAAFSQCEKLTGITMPKSVTTVGSAAFWGCKSLSSVTMPGVVRLGNAFSGCTELKNIEAGEDLTYVGEYAFNDTAYINDSTNFENGVLYIGNCLITASKDLSGHLTVKDGTNGIADRAFEPCHAYLTGVTLPDGIIHIGYEAFDHCGSITSITLPNSLKSIGERAFTYCEKLESISLSDSLETIGSAAFGSSALKSITIPESVTTIGGLAFYDCPGLTDVYYSGTEDKWKAISIGEYNDALKNATVHYNYKP